MKKFFNLIFLISFLFINNLAFANEVSIEDDNEYELEAPKALKLNEWGATNQWHLDVVNNIVDFSFNQDEAITVAVLDTGVSRVSDLSCVNFVNEYDATNGVSGIGSGIDRNGHGTKAALLIAACNDGPYGKGIASGINIMPVKVLSDRGIGLWSWVRDGIYWAVDNGADVINMSLGSYCGRTWYQGCRISWVDDAIEYAASKNVAIIAASGNFGSNYVMYAANHPEVIAVGALKDSPGGKLDNLQITSYSNRGEALDFVAPGQVETLLGSASGTSFSSPQVAAAYAVFKNDNPGISLKTIKEGLVCTVVDLGSKGWDPTYGHGLIQISAAANILNQGLLQKPFFANNELDFSFENKNMHIHWPFLDDCNGIEKISIDIENNGTKKYFNIPADKNSFIYENVIDGKTVVNIRATNVLGTNSETLTSTFIVDITNPVWSENPSIDIKEFDKKLYITFPEAFDGNGILEYVLQINDSTYRLNQAAREYMFIPEGIDGTKYDISIYATDIFGNKSEILTNSYTLPDRTPPEYDGTPLINVEEQTLSNISISWPVFKDYSGIKHYRLVYSAIDNPELSGEVLVQDTKYEFTNLPENIKYSFILYVVDNEDNEVICCTKVVEAKDVIPPTWKELNLGLSITATDGILLFSWDDAEDNIQLKSYNLRLFDQFRNQIEYVQLSPNQTNYQTSQDLFQNGYVLGEIVAADIYGNLSDMRDNAIDFQAPVWGDNTEISFIYEDGFLSIDWPDAKDNFGVLSYLVRFEFYNNDNLEGTDEFRVSESFINNYEPYSNDIDYIYISISPSDFSNDGEFIKSNLILSINNSEAITSSTTSSSTSSTTSSSTSSTTSSSTSSTTSSSTSSTTSSSTSSTTSSSTSSTTTLAPGVTLPNTDVEGDCSDLNLTEPPDNGLYIYATISVKDCSIVTTGFECRRSNCGVYSANKGYGSDGTVRYAWISYQNYLGNWSGYYIPESNLFYANGIGTFQVPYLPPDCLEYDTETNECITTSTTTTTTVPSTTTTIQTQDPYLADTRIWWVNDTDVCFYVEVGGDTTVKWGNYINNSYVSGGQGGGGTGFTYLVRGFSSGDNLTFRTEVRDYFNTLYENTTWGTVTVGQSSSYYRPVTDVGNECFISNNPSNYTPPAAPSTTTTTTTIPPTTTTSSTTTVPPTTTTSSTTTVPPTTTTSSTTTTTVPSQGSNAGLDYIGWFTCSLDGGGPNYKAGVDFNMVSGGTGYVQIEYSLNGGGWISMESNYEISSGFSVTKTAIFSDGSSVQFRYRVSKYNGVHNGVNWSNTFKSGQGEVSSPIELNSSNCN